MQEAWWFPWFISWGGLAFDAGIVPLLFSRPLRLPFGVAGSLMFNGMNKTMFGIGIFQYAMLGSLLLIFEPCFFARLLRLADATAATPFFAPLEGYRAPRWHWWWFVPLPPTDASRYGAAKASDVAGGATPLTSAEAELGGRRSPAPRHAALSWRETAVVGFVGSMIAFHVAYPLRRFILYPAGVSWHEEGHLGAWHMKLRSKHGWVVLLAEEVSTASRARVPPYVHPVTGHTPSAACPKPHAILHELRCATRRAG